MTEPNDTASIPDQHGDLHASSAWLVQLRDFSVVAVTGPDRERFLQGQLSGNMSRLSPAQSLRAALCNLKGRVIADVQVIHEADRILLLGSAGMASIIVATLNKYKVFFKTELQEVTEQFVALGLAGVDTEAALQASGIDAPEHVNACTARQDLIVLRVGGPLPRYYCLLGNNGRQLATDLASRCDTGTEQEWHLADIRAGLAHVRPGQQEMYTPQVLNYDVEGVIDFKKGCYTGQEVVARMYYRAEAKKRLRHVIFDSSAVAPSAEIVSQVTLADGTTEALAIMPVSQDYKP